MDKRTILRTNMEKIRETMEYTRSAMGEMLGASRMTYTNYETGATIPDVFFVLNLAERFGTTVERLCNEQLQSAEIIKNLARAMK